MYEKAKINLSNPKSRTVKSGQIEQKIRKK